MLDPKTLKVGSVVKMTGKVEKIHTDIDDGTFTISLNTTNGYSQILMDKYVMEEAELVSHPEPKFAKEQVEAIKEFIRNKRVTVLGGRPLTSEYSVSQNKIFDWLDEHTEK